jgi:hypothetical protein
LNCDTTEIFKAPRPSTFNFQFSTLNLEPSTNPLSQFSPHLFWDVDAAKLETERSKSYIIKRVLEYGLWEDWLLLEHLYGLETITNDAKAYRELGLKSLAFISVLSHVPIENFRCYTFRQSTPEHWNF